MSSVWKEFKEFAWGHKEWIFLPMIVLLLFLTMVIIFNRNVVHMPFVYSGF